MKQLAYSSTTAFLAHRRVLDEAAAGRGGRCSLSPQEKKILQAMNELMESLRLQERSILLADAASGHGEILSGEERRRWERAELKLRRLLLAKGVLRE